MSFIRASKVVNALPGGLDASTIYLVRIGAGFDMHVTNESGMIVAYPLNQSGGGGGGLSRGQTMAIARRRL